MPGIFKVLGTEATCNTTASSFGNNKVVRLVNTDTAAHLVTVARRPGGTIATITINASESLLIEKNPTDTLASNAATTVVRAVPVAYRN
jgi:hypothetical protein